MCHPGHANSKAGQVGVAQLVRALLAAMRTAVNLHHQPRLSAMEIDEAWWERLWSPEMDAQASATYLLPHHALFGSPGLAQCGSAPP